MKKILFFCTALLLTACATAPQGLEKDDFTLSRFDQIQAEDLDCQCKLVRLGGKVLSATAMKGKTRIEVLSLNVSRFSAKPVLDSRIEGRFIAYLDGFIDPESLKDQYITVKGVLKGQEIGKIDQVDYQYPVIQANAFRQWKLVQEYYYDPSDCDDDFGFRMRSRFFCRPKLRYALY